MNQYGTSSWSMNSTRTDIGEKMKDCVKAIVSQLPIPFCVQCRGVGLRLCKHSSTLEPLLSGCCLKGALKGGC